MSGPCSYPAGDKREQNRLNEMMCDRHKDCTPASPVGKDLEHEFVTTRMWLLKRNRLRTGKTI